MSDNIFYVFLRHGHTHYWGGQICNLDGPGTSRPASESIKCRLRKSDGRFTTMENLAGNLRRGSVVPAEDIAFFLREEDLDIVFNMKTSKYIYDIVQPGIMRNPTHCQSECCQP